MSETRQRPNVGTITKMFLVFLSFRKLQGFSELCARSWGQTHTHTHAHLLFHSLPSDSFLLIIMCAEVTQTESLHLIPIPPLITH